MAKKAKKTSGTDSIDMCFSFDTTGSMSACIGAVRKNVAETVKKLFAQIPDLRVSIIAHGDYCDKGTTYVTSILDFTDEPDDVTGFVRKVKNTFGGDADECYELVLHQARKELTWKSGRRKILVMIGDSNPHGVSYPDNKLKLDWKNEAGLLKEAGVSIYSVHCMPGIRSESSGFYKHIAKVTDGYYLTLDQFSDINNLIFASAYKQVDDSQLEDFAEEIIKSGRMTKNMQALFATLTGKAEKYCTYKCRGGLEPVPAGRFQVLDVDEEAPIADFVRDQGVEFRKGRGFYELTKKEKVQGYKEIVLMDRDSGDIFSGNQVRKILGLPEQVDKHDDDREDVKIEAAHLDEYKVFVQSTSANRKLVPGTSLLYEVSDC